ncbi:MAG TPA: hypothetical protein PLN38_07075 [Chitinophagales bacterium]|nr:hypothetical protein [Chitinophagales bacterium]
MFQEEFNSIINDPGNIMDIALADVKGISERYPYCQAAQVIYAKKLRELNSPLFEQQLKKAAVAVYDRNALFQYIERSVTPQVAVSQPMHKEQTVSETLADTSNFVEETIAIANNNAVTEHPVIPQPDEIQPEIIITQTTETVETIELPIEDAFEEPVEEVTLSQPIEVIDQIQQPVEDVKVVDETEQILTNIMESTPELMVPELPEETMANQDEPEIELPQEEILIPDETLLTDEFVEQIISGEITDEVLEPSEEDFMDESSEELIFDLPGYDIERELGTLAEDEMIKIQIQKPVEEQVNEEAFEDSFIGWLNRLGGPTKGKLVEMKAANLPIKKYMQASPVAGVSEEKSRQVKVVDEIIAGELARKSLQADDHLVTETYARILTMQGKYNKAVDMYMKLSLLKPQKSDYFAALIDQIKKRIK